MGGAAFFLHYTTFFSFCQSPFGKLGKFGKFGKHRRKPKKAPPKGSPLRGKCLRKAESFFFWSVAEFLFIKADEEGEVGKARFIRRLRDVVFSALQFAFGVKKADLAEAVFRCCEATALVLLSARKRAGACPRASFQKATRVSLACLLLYANERCACVLLLHRLGKLGIGDKIINVIQR